MQFLNNYDYFIQPNSDEFFLEYLPESEKRIQYISGFTGSNALIVFARDKNYFFTDGRYILQAKNELDLNEYEIFNTADNPLFTWLSQNLKKSQTVAIDAKIVSVNFVRQLKKIIDNASANLVFLDQNPIDEIWKNRPEKENSAIFFHDLKYSGLDSKSKRALVLQDCKADAILFSRPESLCWLLNIRASDTEYTPLLTAYAILYKDGSLDLFADENRLESSNDKVFEFDFNMINSKIIIPKKHINSIQIDPSATNYALYQSFKNIEIVEKSDPAMLHKACKNKTEIAGAVQAHEIDGLAVTKFLFWLEQNIGTNELEAEAKLLELRQMSDEFLYPSFRSISSFASNGAVIHYHAEAKTNKKIEGNSLYLIDSGGQYLCGTTDITRTVAIGEPSQEMIDDFTLVLKGHIALSCVKFPRSTTGAQLDSIARAPLWSQGKDYDHGTGHGVGSFLSVHEGPCSISKRAVSQELLPGMILSNEPGYYRENAYGIRIENLMLVEETEDNFLQFATLTLAPIDYRLINFTMLTENEKNWLYFYHKKIFFTHERKLDSAAKAWLASFATIYKNLINIS